MIDIEAGFPIGEGLEGDRPVVAGTAMTEDVFDGSVETVTGIEAHISFIPRLSACGCEAAMLSANDVAMSDNMGFIWATPGSVE